MSQVRNLAAPAAAGILLALSFPSPLSSTAIAPLGWVALVPFLLYASRRRPNARLAAGYAVFSLLYFGIVLYWIPPVLTGFGGIGWPLAAAIFLLLLLSQSLLTAVVPLGMAWTARCSRSAALAAAPGLWLAAELLRDQLPFGGFPWAAIGYSQAGALILAQAADLGGVYTLGFLLVAVNTLLAAGWVRRDWRQAAAAGGLFLLLVAYGGFRTWLWAPQPLGSIQVGLVQDNLLQYAEQEHYAVGYFEELPRLFDRAVADGAEWVVLPEAQNPYQFGADFYYTNFWTGKARNSGVWLLLNSATEGDPPDGRLRNTAFLLAPDGSTALRYDKVQLVPFGEYVPLSGLFGLAGSVVDSVADFAPGEAIRLGRVGGFTVAPQICFEALFPRISRTAAGAGAQLLVNLTNDGWYGETAAPRQHLDIARFRAIETRRTLVRATNTGVSAIISPWGEVLESTPLFRATQLVGEAAFYDEQSLFSLSGGVLNGILIIGTGLLVGRAWSFSRPTGSRPGR